MKQARRLMFALAVVTFISICASISYAKYALERSVIAAKLEIDRTKPIGNVQYSLLDMTNGEVDVTINLNEKISKVDGWILSENQLTMTKTYEENATNKIKIVDLSGNENVVEVSVQNIDKVAPVIELIGVKNTNESFANYANNTHTITATIKIKDTKINSSIDISKIDVYVGDNRNVCNKTLKNLNQSETEITFDLVVTNLEGNGDLSFNIPKAFVTDEAGNATESVIFSTSVIVDNIKPKGNYSQEVLQNGKVEACIIGSEELRELESWDTSDNKIFKKEFPANVSYIIEIIDFAQNTSSVEVNITGATFIVLTYASHNSEVGWTYGLGNYDIAGKDAVKQNPKFKTEALAFRITGGVDSNFVKVRGYVNSYWNTITDFGKCKATGYKYKVRGAPNSAGDLYYSMNSSDLSTINGEKYIQLGGAGINQYRNTDYNGNNPIPYDVVYNGYDGVYPYGVSEVQISLADYSELSVVYQILVNGKGWIMPVINGEVATAGQETPMSAIRVAIIPNSEVDSLMKLWNKDTETYNVD